MYVLAFHLPEADKLLRIHGREVIDVVDQDVTGAFQEIADDLLRQHERLSPVLTPAFGTWLVPFEMGHPEIDVEADEQAGSITAAGKEMVRRMLQEQLGMGVAVRTDYRVAVIETDVSVTEPDLLLERIRPQLDILPTPSSTPPKITRAAFGEIVHGGQIDLHLQPILALQGPRVVGFEALARGPAGSLVRDAGSLFGAASYFDMEEELDLACVAAALEWAPKIPKPYWISINMSPELLTHQTLQTMLEDQVNGAAERQVLELTEHLPIHSSLRLHRAITPLRERGARLALDDAGCGFFNMETVRALTPDIVKICITVVRRIDGNPKVLAAVKEMVKKVTDSGAVALGEGVERPEQAKALRECGVHLAQGFLYSKPRPAGEVLAELV